MLRAAGRGGGSRRARAGSGGARRLPARGADWGGPSPALRLSVRVMKPLITKPSERRAACARCPPLTPPSLLCCLDHGLATVAVAAGIALAAAAATVRSDGCRGGVLGSGSRCGRAQKEPDAETPAPSARPRRRPRLLGPAGPSRPGSRPKIAGCGCQGGAGSVGPSQVADSEGLAAAAGPRGSWPAHPPALSRPGVRNSLGESRPGGLVVAWDHLAKTMSYNQPR